MTPTAGTVESDWDTRIGYFWQFSELTGDRSIDDELKMMFAAIHALQTELDAINATLASNPAGELLEHSLARQARLLEQVEFRRGLGPVSTVSTQF